MHVKESSNTGAARAAAAAAGMSKSRKRNSQAPLSTKVVDIEGMTCGHCKGRVEQALDTIDGAAAEVNLHRNHAVVKMTREVSDDEIRRALAGSGYTITGIHIKD